jgi:hypothetical protein
MLLESKKNDDELVRSLKREMLRLSRMLRELEEKQMSGFARHAESWDRDAAVGEITQLRVACEKKAELVELYANQLADRDNHRIQQDLELVDARKQANILRARLKNRGAGPPKAVKLEQLEAEVMRLERERATWEERYHKEIAAKTAEVQTLRAQVALQETNHKDMMENLRDQMQHIKDAYHHVGTHRLQDSVVHQKQADASRRGKQEYSLMFNDGQAANGSGRPSGRSPSQAALSPTRTHSRADHATNTAPKYRTDEPRSASRTE